MITWLTPTRRVRFAAGSCTLHSSWRGLQPAITPASSTESGTVRMPRMVQRAIGGMAKIAVAIMPGTEPKPKKAATGPK